MQKCCESRHRNQDLIVMEGGCVDRVYSVSMTECVSLTGCVRCYEFHHEYQNLMVIQGGCVGTMC